MMSFPAWTDNPVADAESYQNYLDDRIRELPVCEDCGEHIQDEYYYEISGSVICQKCLDDYKKWIV